MVSVSFKDFSMGEGQTWERCEGFGIHDKFKRFVKKVGNALKSNLKEGSGGKRGCRERVVTIDICN